MSDTEPRPAHTVRQSLPVRPDVLQAIVVAIATRMGEPLIDPTRIVFSMSRPDIEAAIGRPLELFYVQDELNPFGKVELTIPER